jgi:hypothetical protein
MLLVATLVPTSTFGEAQVEVQSTSSATTMLQSFE